MSIVRFLKKTYLHGSLGLLAPSLGVLIIALIRVQLQSIPTSVSADGINMETAHKKFVPHFIDYSRDPPFLAMSGPVHFAMWYIFHRKANVVHHLYVSDVATSSQADNTTAVIPAGDSKPSSPQESLLLFMWVLIERFNNICIIPIVVYSFIPLIVFAAAVVVFFQVWLQQEIFESHLRFLNDAGIRNRNGYIVAFRRIPLRPLRTRAHG